MGTKESIALPEYRGSKNSHPQLEEMCNKSDFTKTSISPKLIKDSIETGDQGYPEVNSSKD